MKKFLLIIMGVCLNLTLWSTTITTIELKESGTLLNLLTDSQIERTEKIVVTGNELNANDFNILKGMIVKQRLREIDIENTCTFMIPEYAFENCLNLEKIKLPKYLIQINRLAFRNCSNLSEIKLPSSLKIMFVGAFWGCSSLTTITLNRQLQKIDSQAFLYCNNLKEIHCIGAIPPQCEYGSFEGLYENCILYVPEEYKKTYAYSDGWLYFNNIREERVEAPCLLDVSLHNGQFVWQLYPDYEGIGGAIVREIYPEEDCTLEVETGETVVLYIEPQTGYSEKTIDVILLDGIDITSQLTGPDFNILYITINKDSHLDIFIKEKIVTSNESMINEDIKVFTTSDYIIVNNIGIGDKVNIYNLSGALVYSKKSESNKCEIQVSGDQVYIVQVGTKAFKVKK